MPLAASAVGVEVGAVYVVTGPDGTRAVFNDPGDPDHVGFLDGDDGVTGLERAGVRESADDLPEADGGVHGAFRYGRLTFTLKGRIDHHPGGEHYDVVEQLAFRNLMVNPSAEVNVTDGGIQAMGGFVARSTAQAFAGAASFELTAPAGGGNMSVRHIPGRFPVTPGLPYSAGAYFRAAAATPRGCNTYLDFYDAGGVRIAAPVGAGVMDTATGWTRAIIENAVAPANAVTAQIIAQVGAAGANEVHYIDGLLAVQGATIPAYFDGDTYPAADNPPYRTEWEGTAHNSPSRLLNVSRAPWEEARVRAHRIDRLLRATDAMLGDAQLAWTPSSADPIRLLFRQQQPTRISGRRPKSFLVAGVSEAANSEGQTVNRVTIDPAAPVIGGLTSPLSSPMTSASSSASAATAIVGGTRPTWPVITITGPLTNPVVRSLRYGRELRLGYTLAAGETLVIDTDPRRRTIRLNGTTSRFGALDWLASMWWPLAPGPNDLRVSVSALSTGSSVLVEWRDAWG